MMSIGITRKQLGLIVLVGVLLTAASSFVRIKSESYMGSSCMACDDIVKTGDISYTGVPLSFLAHYPSADLNGQTAPYSKFNGFIFAADILLWAVMLYATVWLVGHQKADVVRGSK